MSYVWGASVRDVLSFGDESLVLTQTQLLRLGPVGALVLHECEGGTTLAAIEASAGAKFGDPPSGTLGEAIEQIVSDLLEQGVLQAVS